MLGAVVSYVLTVTRRDRLPLGLLVLAGLLALAVIAIGDTALLEKPYFNVVYAAGSLRFAFVFGIAIFTAITVQRLFDSREIETLLARALRRETLIFGFWVGLGLAGTLMVLPYLGLLVLMAPSTLGALAWAVSIVLELWIVLAFAIFAAMTLERAVLAILAFSGFYILGRLSGYFLGMTKRVPGNSGVDANKVLEAVSVLVPRLDMFGQTEWLIYGPGDGLILVVIQAFVFIVLLLGATIFDLNRKAF